MSVHCQNCDHLRAENSLLQGQLATANKQTKHIKGGAENNIYNLLNDITDNKYGPYSVSRKDDVVPQWFDALAKETKVLIAELDTANDENNRLREVLVGDSPFPLLICLEELADAADHLLDDHQCDKHGYELVAAAKAETRLHILRITQALKGE